MMRANSRRAGGCVWRRRVVASGAVGLAALTMAPAVAAAAPNDTVLVSRASGVAGAAANADSSAASISQDGRYVAFESHATNLSADDASEGTDVYVRDLVANTTTLASRASGVAGARSGGGQPSISDDGRLLAFTTMASLSPDDLEFGDFDVYVRDLVAHTTTLVSRASGVAGAVGDRGSSQPSISGDGRYVAFTSGASNLTAESVDVFFHEVYVRDLQAHTTTMVSGPLSRMTNILRESDGSSMSSDGRYVAFMSTASTLSPDDTDSIGDVYVRDLTANTMTLVSRATGIAGAKANDESSLGSISADGRHVVFQSAATNLSSDHARDFSDVYVRDLVANTTTLVSRATGAAGAPAEYGGGGGSISGDGRLVAFSSSAELSPEDAGDFDLVRDVFVRDLEADTTTLVSRATGASGAKGNDDSSLPMVSADGRRVAFESFAANLSPDDTRSDSDVFVRELGPAGSPPPSGTPPPATPPGATPPHTPILGAPLTPGTPKPGAPLAPGVPTFGSTSATAPLRAALTEAANALRPLRIRGLLRKGRSTFAFVAPAAGTLTAIATAQIAGPAAASARTVTVLMGKRTFVRAEKGTIRLTLTNRGRRALRRAGRVTLKLKLAFVDAAGSTFSRSRTVRLKR